MNARCRLLVLVSMVALFTSLAQAQEKTEPLPKGATTRLGNKPAIRTSSTLMGMVVLPDGKQAVTSDSKSVSVWDLETGGLVSSSPVPTKKKDVTGNPFRTTPPTTARNDSSNRVTVHRSQGVLALGTDGKSVILAHRDLLQSREFHRFALPLDPAQPPASYGDTIGLDSTAAIVFAGDTLFGLSVRGRLGELRGGTRFGRLSIPPVAGDWLAIATGGGIVAYGGEDERVRIWDAVNNKNLGHIDTAAVRALAVSADGKTLVASSFTPLPRVEGNSGSTVVWNIPERKEVCRWQDASSILTVSSDGKLAAMVGEPGRIRLFDATNGKPIKEMGMPGVGYLFIEFLKGDSALVAGSTTNEIHVFDIATGKPRPEKTGHSATVTGVHVLPDGAIITAGADGFIRVWEASGKELRKFQCEERGISALLVSEDGKTAFTAGGGAIEPRARAWDLSNGGKLREYAQDRYAGMAMNSLASNGKVLAAGFARTDIHLLDLNTFKLIGKLQPVGGLFLNDVAFAANGRIVARVGTTYAVLDSTKSEVVKVIGTKLPFLPGRDPHFPRIGVSPDGSQFAAPNTGPTGKSVLGIWKTEDGAHVENLDLPKAGSLQIASYHPDGKTIAVGDAEGRVWLVDSVLKSEPILLEGHTGPVTALAFSKDGRKLVSGGSDTTAVVWNLPAR